MALEVRAPRRTPRRGLRQSGASGSQGPAVDQRGDLVVDPTANVLDLVGAAVERLNDLALALEKHVSVLDRRQDDLRIDTRETFAREVASVRQYEEALRKAETQRLNEVAALDRAYAKEIRDNEKQRIDDIRAVDVGAVGKASEVAAAAASQLAQTLSATAEVQRTALASTVAPILATLENLRTRLDLLAGAKTEQSEGKQDQRTGQQNNQWLIGVAIGLAVVALDFINKRIG